MVSDYNCYCLLSNLPTLCLLPSAIARFCEAIIDYLADEQRSSASGITASQFEGEVFSAYDTLFNVWMLSKDARVNSTSNHNNYSY